MAGLLPQLFKKTTSTYAYHIKYSVQFSISPPQKNADPLRTAITKTIVIIFIYNSTTIKKLNNKSTRILVTLQIKISAAFYILLLVHLAIVRSLILIG